RLLESGDSINSSALFDFAIDEIFVFTPDGDLRRLSPGASVLDFAFDIHSNLGLRCSGAKINGKPASIRERLKTGDVVEIISSKNQKPSVDWLNYVVSSKARAKIKQKLDEETGKRAEEGKELLERRVNNWKLEYNDEVIVYLLKHYKYKTAPEFYIAIATDVVDIAQIKGVLTARERERDSTEPKEGTPVPLFKTDKAGTSSSASSDYLIIDEKVSNVGFKLAKCCNPIFGDDIFGFVTIREGIKIHRISCPNAARLFDNYPYRIQKVKWREGSTGHSFQTALRISGYGEAATGQQIMEVINTLNISLRQFSISEQKGRLEAKMQVSVSNNQLLDKLIFNLRKLKGIKSVSRISI
ncbi:MAG: TGS domain-containing protein, partial [Bacteroidales bacterium]|nr:TGS domain-containing protein [Bacteroidales bacterium]